MSMPPILVADLFPEVSQRLVELLRSLSAKEWHLPTVNSRRTVKDIASHLLDGSLRRLSMQRDGYRPADGRSQPREGEPLVDFLNRLNDEWETGARRLSPKVLVDPIEWADTQLADLFRSLDPHGPVAGEGVASGWQQTYVTEGGRRTWGLFGSPPVVGLLPCVAVRAGGENDGEEQNALELGKKVVEKLWRSASAQQKRTYGDLP